MSANIMFGVVDEDGRFCAIFPSEDEAKDWRKTNRPTCMVVAASFGWSPVHKTRCVQCNGEGFTWGPK